MNIDKIGKIEAIALIITIMINQIILNIPNIILLSTGTSSVLNSIYTGFLSILFVIIICKFFKPFANNDIIDISEYLGGKPLKLIIGIVYIMFFLLVCSLGLRYFSNSLKLIYFNNTPIIFLLLLFLIPPIILVKIGLKSISGTNIIFVPLTLISLVVLLLAIYKDFVPERIFPLFGYGFNRTFISGSTNVFAFAGIAYLYFMPPLLKNVKDFKSVSLISIIISGFYLFFSILSLLMSFASITITDEMFSIYLLTRLVRLRKILAKN